MGQAIIFFAVLAYIIPGIIIARDFYTKTYDPNIYQKTYEDCMENKASYVAEETAQYTETVHKIYTRTATVLTLLVWPLASILILIFDGPAKKERAYDKLQKQNAAKTESIKSDIRFWEKQLKNCTADDTITRNLAAQYLQLNRERLGELNGNAGT